MLLSRSQKESGSYTILTPVETKDGSGNPIKISGWIGESHSKDQFSSTDAYEGVTIFFDRSAYYE